MRIEQLNLVIGLLVGVAIGLLLGKPKADRNDNIRSIPRPLGRTG
jgi:hypothetical protein